MDSQFMQTDVIVIGGGLAGLSAACYLAQAGVSVTLFEKASKLGGRAATQKYDDYSFNRGGHALYTGGAATQVLQELGIAYSGHTPKLNFALHQGKIHTYPANAFALLRNNLLSGADKLELARLFASLPRLKPHTLSHVSVREWLERTFQRPLVRQFVASSARTLTYSAALEQVSAEVFLLQMQQLLKHGVLYIDGGWQTLIDELQQAAERAGVRIVSGTRIEEVVYQDGSVKGVRLRTGETMHASAVVVAANPHEASVLVDGGMHPSLRKLAETIIPLQVACLDVALRRLPPPPHYPVLLDLDQPRFLAFQSLTARIAPREGGLIHILKYLDPAHPTDPREDELDLENLLDAAQPGWRGEVVKRIFLPRIEAINMLVTAVGGGLSGRPGPLVDGIDGLYLAGDWIGTEGYLADASMASARQVAHLILHKQQVSSRPSVTAQTSAV